jgi:hypothetical protein
MYSIYLFDTFPNIEPPFLDDSVVQMLLTKSEKNINSSRECSTTFISKRSICFFPLNLA